MARLPCARKGDSHSHGGAIVAGSPNVFCDGLPVARVGDLVACPVHGTVVLIASGSSATVLTNGLRTARFGNVVSCGAIIVSASPNVAIGD